MCQSLDKNQNISKEFAQWCLIIQVPVEGHCNWSVLHSQNTRQVGTLPIAQIKSDFAFWGGYKNCYEYIREMSRHQQPCRYGTTVHPVYPIVYYVNEFKRNFNNLPCNETQNFGTDLQYIFIYIRLYNLYRVNLTFQIPVLNFCISY